MDQAPIKIFRPGTFRSMEGKTVVLGEAELQAIAEAYDPESAPAPFVIGHPKIDTPAAGWAKRLSVENGFLVAHPDKVDASFAAMVNEGRFPRVSLQFFGERDPANPRPGTLYPRHVGFLGGAAPGVSGLGTVSFADGADPAALTTIEAALDAGAASFAADPDTPTPHEEEPPVAEPDPNTPDPNTPDVVSFAAREAALADREAAIAAREAEADRKASETIHAGNVSFAATLVAGALLPAHAQDLFVGLLDQLDGLETVSFGAGTDEMTGSAALRKLFEGAKPLVELGEKAPAGPGAAIVTVSFSAPPGYQVSDLASRRYARALELQRATPGLSLIDAGVQAESEIAS